MKAVTSILTAITPAQLDGYLDRADEDARAGVTGAVARGDFAIGEVDRRRARQYPVSPGSAA